MAHSDDESVLELDTNPNDFDFFESNDFQKQKSNKNEDEKNLLKIKRKSDQRESSKNEDIYGPKSSAKNSENSDNFFGPALPAKKSKKIIGPKLPKHSTFSEDNNLSSNNDVNVGPQLPPHLIARSNSDTILGPQLPSHLIAESKIDSTLGPQLPPHLIAQSNSETILGPQLPSHLIAESKIDATLGPQLPPHLIAQSNSDIILGPQLPPHLIARSNDTDESEEFIGPLPGMVSKNTEEDNLLYAQAQVIERAQKMKDRLTGTEPQMKQRESWMLELPPDRANEFGLGPRQFRRKEKNPTGDRSVWTTTPQERLEQNNCPSTSNVKQEEMEMNFIKERDEAMQKLSDSHKSKKKKKSLLEKHQKKLKKKMKKEASKPIERRPFDRNVDLQANRFDDAMKKSIIKKAQLLDDRFSKGKSKFL